MSITFRVIATDDDLTPPPTAITIRQLVKFRVFARDNQIVMSDHGDDKDISLMLDFEVSICGAALAVLARIFDHSEDVIVLMEEAQFTQRQVRFHKDHASGELMVSLADTIDGACDLNLANSNAYALLEVLDMPPDSIGDMPLTQLRDRLADPQIRAGFRRRQVDRYLPRLDKLAAIEVYQAAPIFTWS